MLLFFSSFFSFKIILVLNFTLKKFQFKHKKERKNKREWIKEIKNNNFFNRIILENNQTFTNFSIWILKQTFFFKSIYLLQYLYIYSYISWLISSFLKSFSISSRFFCLLISAYYSCFLISIGKMIVAILCAFFYVCGCCFCCCLDYFLCVLKFRWI